MNIEPIQQSIVDQLQAAFVASSLPFQAKNLPDNEADYTKAVQGPIAFVVYTGSTSPGVKNTNPITQERKLQFSVECFGRGLYGAAGLFAVRNTVELALIGFRPTNCQRMYLVKDDIDKGKDTIWAHVFQFECMTMLVQDTLSDPVIVPSFTNLTAKFENIGDADDDGNDESTTIIPTS